MAMDLPRCPGGSIYSYPRNTSEKRVGGRSRKVPSPLELKEEANRMWRERARRPLASVKEIDEHG